MPTAKSSSAFSKTAPLKSASPQTLRPVAGQAGEPQAELLECWNLRPVCCRKWTNIGRQPAKSADASLQIVTLFVHASTRPSSFVQRDGHIEHRSLRTYVRTEAKRGCPVTADNRHGPGQTDTLGPRVASDRLTMTTVATYRSRCTGLAQRCT